jgi:branched-chain amino acid transport system permease protein
LLFKYANSTAGDAYVIGTARLGGFNGIPGYGPLNVPGFPDLQVSGLALYYVAAACLLAGWLLVRWICARAFGRRLVGIRENELRAQLLGYDVRLAKTIAFGIGGALAGLAGVLYACWAEIVTPEVFTLGVAAEVIIWVLVGGLGTLWGPMLGAVLLGALKAFLGGQQLVNNAVVMGVLLIAIVLFLPSGVVPSFARAWASYRQRRSYAPASREQNDA